MPHPFLTELRTLLAKHRASIGWTCGEGSDTHGLHDERMTIEVGGKTIAEVHGSDISASDLPASKRSTPP